MAANANDFFIQVGSPGTATNLAGSGYTIGAPSITVDTTTNWPTLTGVIFGIDVIETDSNGNEVRVDGSYCIFEGVVTSGTTIGSVDRIFGTPQNYSAGATTRVYITISTEITNRLVQGLLVEHNQLGQHTLTSNSTLTSPKVITSLNDTNGNELFKVTPTASAVNEFTITNGATGNAPILSATGSDTNIDVNIAPKGTGVLRVGGAAVNIGAWTTWTPTFSAFTLGNGVINYAKYTQIGKTVHLKLRVTLGTTSVVSGAVGFSPPVNLTSDYTNEDFILSTVVLRDATGQENNGVLIWSSATRLNLGVMDTAGTAAQNGTVGASTPFTWATNDFFQVNATYEGI